jgi:hypothetical protein
MHTCIVAALAAGVAWRDLPTNQSGDGENVGYTPDLERFTRLEAPIDANQRQS